ncbi:hypothetical protein NEOLEDRAFT_351453 [Neolentinus lepideus HHB14362 ss-1]|uniref:F-box domain-containing protein n=1 Tax=Neolentinus lepideus HHB14362 ss-1 TaxID=1314782 RepID=A0A165SS16_9AGAM|nr:hypothetical protein NEOLEDRAFT_351453 [Neolentinus lepideus HHB14362 ss-1]
MSGVVTLPQRLATIHDLPLEILLSFVISLMPKYCPPSHIWEMIPGLEMPRIKQYHRDLRSFREMARISRAFRSAVEYCLYTTIVIFHDTDVANLADALQKHGPRVRTIIYDATLRDFPDKGNKLDRYLDLDRCLTLMTNLHTMKVFGSHILFMPANLRASWQTVQPEFPSFALPSSRLPPIRVLRWKCQSKALHYDKQVLHALSLLSSSLEELSIDDWNTTRALISTISKPFPRLRTLNLVGGNIPLDALSSLIDLTIQTGKDGEKTSSLASLILWDRYDEEEINRETEVKELLANHPSGMSLVESVFLNYTTLPTIAKLANVSARRNLPQGNCPRPSYPSFSHVNPWTLDFIAT